MSDPKEHILMKTFTTVEVHSGECNSVSANLLSRKFVKNARILVN